MYTCLVARDLASYSPVKPWTRCCIREATPQTVAPCRFVRAEETSMAKSTNKNTDGYTYRVTWSDENQEYVGLCSEFPSLSWLASTRSEALRGVRRLVADVTSDSSA